VIDLQGRVAIVTGAGGGLGRAHARLLAQRGARVVVNDLGEGAETVAAEIVEAGGKARAALGSVTDAARMQAIVDEALSAWGRVDILVNNAGILRDKTFAKMSLKDFRLVVDVHLMGAANCTKAVWDAMRAQNYGRIVMTTSSSGLYGNFGQSNYGAAKLALVGLMQTLALEGAKYDIRVNCLAPTAATQMLEGLLPPEQLALLRPDLVSPAVLALVSDAHPDDPVRRRRRFRGRPHHPDHGHPHSRRSAVGGNPAGTAGRGYGPSRRDRSGSGLGAEPAGAAQGRIHRSGNGGRRMT